MNFRFQYTITVLVIILGTGLFAFARLGNEIVGTFLNAAGQVTTLEVSALGDSSAVLRGDLSQINDHEEADVYFKYREVGEDMEETWWIIADTHIGSHRDNEENALENLQKAVADANELGLSQKAIVLGDLVHDSPEFVEPFENAMNQLDHEWTYVLGNHDFDRHGSGKRLFERVFFSKDIGGIRFIAVSDDGSWAGSWFPGDVYEAYQTEKNLMTDQDDWFRGELDRDPGKPTVLLSHQGLKRMYERDSDDGPCFWDPERRGWLQKNWDDYNIIMWMRGHRHNWNFDEDYRGYGFVDVSPGAMGNDWRAGAVYMTITREGDTTTIWLRFRDSLFNRWSRWAGVTEYKMEVVHGWGETVQQNMTGSGEFSSTIDRLLPGREYEFMAVAVVEDEKIKGDVLTFTTAEVTGAIQDAEEIPESFGLRQNYPNPFNSTTVIEYYLRDEEHVRLQVFDTTGRLITELVNERMPSGTHMARFDATGLSSGVYLYKLRAGMHEQSKPMTLIK